MLLLSGIINHLVFLSKKSYFSKEFKFDTLNIKAYFNILFSNVNLLDQMFKIYFYKIKMILYK